MKILMVAADPMEFRGMPRRNDFLLKAGGVGAKYAATAVDAALKGFHADAVISTGFCGALDPAMNVGDLVVATEVVAGDCRFPALQPESATNKTAHTGVVVS